MLLSIAWRNIWRNPVRSIVVMGAIAIGIWATIFMTGFATGMANGYVDNAIANVIAHLQIHNPAYLTDEEVQYALPKCMERTSEIEAMPEVEAISARTIANGMIASSKGARGIRIRGVVPEAEQKVSGINDKIVEGTYFTEKQRNPILISTALAEKLGLKLRSRLVLTFQDEQGEIISSAFRVNGIFKTSNKAFDEGIVFVLQTDLKNLVAPGVEDFSHEIAILLHQSDQTAAFQQKLKNQYPDWTVRSYGDISPELKMYESQIAYVSFIYLFIIMLALIFGIVNTMLMAVLERVRELGMLMAVGMNKFRVFFMIVFETCFLGLIGGPLGLGLGALTIAGLGHYGVNLSMFSESLRMYGMSELVYFEVDPVVYWQMPIGVAITALLASIYPAWKAVRLRPVEAIRKI